MDMKLEVVVISVSDVDRWDWYAAYMDARAGGSTPEEASAAAGRYMAEVKHVVSPV